MLKTRGASIAATLAGKETTPVTVDIETMRKDLRTMVAEAKSRGFELPVTSSVLECFDAAVKDGWGSRDVTMFPARFLGKAR
jgi:3-hydroxyisobutyrate dehydrogenase